MVRLDVPGQPRVVFRQGVEVFLNGVSAKMTAALKADLKRSGLDVEQPLAAYYPAERMPEWTGKAAKHLYPGLGRDEALKQVGYLLIDGWQHTMIGSATTAVMSVVSAQEAIRRTADYFRASNNYTEITVFQRSAHEFEIAMSDVFNMAWYYVGLLEAGARLTKAREPRVTVSGSHPPGATFKMWWLPD
jgi:uncharacterized protein (TIGR02265 family)